MKKKYELTDETIEFAGHVLHRIKALVSFADVEEGDLGGWIEKESNLSHLNNAWVYGGARVFGDAVVSGGARVFGDAVVSDGARVFGNAEVYGGARVYGNAEVSDDAVVYGNAVVYGGARVFGDAVVSGGARVFGDAVVSDGARVFGNAEVYGGARVYGNAEVSDDAVVYGNAVVSDGAVVYGNAVVSSMDDYITFKNFWSSGRYFTWTRSNNKWKVGCFYGTGDELISKAYEDSQKSGREYERVVKYVESILHDEPIKDEQKNEESSSVAASKN